MYQPLAELLRPTVLNEVVGQEHLIGSGKPLSSLNKPQSLILWGPPGVGKTTLALVLAKTWDCEIIKLSAVFSGIKEIKQALETASINSCGIFARQTVLFIDEIHRFNKAQQDAFLHHLEEGKIILIGATTENPSFELNNALLSRMQVYILKPLQNSDLEQLLDRGLTNLNSKFELTADAREWIINLADGDARRLFNIIEMLANANINLVTQAILQQILPNSLKRFDKGGEEFYNQISALHKAVRGSDPDAALYWFSRMLNGGADPLYIGRRLVRMAWEDIGLSDINAQTVALNALSTYERLGSPEGELALASAIIYMAVTTKSNSTDSAFKQVKNFVEHNNSHEVPLHLRNAPTKLMQDLGYGREYHYAHNYPYHYVPNESYLPDNMPRQQFYTPNTQGLENKIIERLKFLRELDKNDKQTNK